MSTAAMDDKPNRARGTRIGWVPIAFAWVLLFFLPIALAASGLGVLVASPDPADMAARVATVPFGLAGAVVLLIGFAALAFRSARRLQRGTTGRARLMALAVAGVLDWLCYTGLVVVLALNPQAIPDLSSGPFNPYQEILQLAPLAQMLTWALVAVGTASMLVKWGLLWSCWFLIPELPRKIFWWVFDVPLLAAFVFAVWTLPIEVPRDHPEYLPLAVIRLSLTVAFGTRLAFRLFPLFMDLVESAGVHAMVAVRNLRAKKSDFLAIIGILSVLAVTLSSCALTTTLSVMGGFRQDLKRKILGNNAHVVVDKEHDTFDEWVPMLQRVRDTQGVIAATPYVSGEVMVTSASNLAGGVLRGIDPETVSDVIDLERNMVDEDGNSTGRIEYLVHPERLLNLPPEELRGPMPLQLPSARPQRRNDPPEPIDADPTRVIEGLGDPPNPMDHVPDPAEAEELDGFLRGPQPAQIPRDVLPGIIVGRELARSLRLYLGDEINVVSPFGDLGPTGPIPKSRPFRVAGIFHSGMYEFDMKYAYVTLETAQRFLNVDEAISGIEVKVENIEQAPEIAKRVENALGRTDLRVQDWQSLNQNLFGALQVERLAMFIALGIAILVAGFCVFATLTLMIQEKEGQVGVLKAMGTTKAGIVKIFMLDGLMIGLFGSILGLGLGYVACFAAEHFGVKMDPEVYYIDRLPVYMDGGEFAAVGIAAVVVCLLATVIPAVLASMVRPVDALRFE